MWAPLREGVLLPHPWHPPVQEESSRPNLWSWVFTQLPTAQTGGSSEGKELIQGQFCFSVLLVWGGDSHLVPQHPTQLLRDPSGGSGRKTGLGGALLLELTSDLMPVGFLASPSVCSSRDREPRAPVCPPVEAFMFQKPLLFIDPPFTWCFNSIDSSWFCFLELYFPVFQKIWPGAQCPLRPSESKSSRSRTQELASLLPVSFSLSTFSLSLYFYSIFCFLSLLLLSLSFLPLYTQTQTHTALQVPDSEAGALTLGSQCPRVWPVVTYTASNFS